MAKIVTYSMPRGDSRSLPFSIPVGTYSVGASIFFALKTAVDNVANDSTAVLKKTLTDANITSNDGVNVNYVLSILPSDTNSFTDAQLATYLAELEFVSLDGLTVITYPDPEQQIWKWTITGEIGRAHV